MATQIQIYNQALINIGARATVLTLTDPTVECTVLNARWPQAVAEMLELHDWSFARRRALLTTTTLPLVGWPFVYTLPGDCLRFRGIFNNIMWGEQPIVPFEVSASEGAGGAADVAIVGTVLPNAWGIYTKALPDTSFFPQLICSALGFALSAMIGLELTESAQLGSAMQQIAMTYYDNAFEEDRQQRRNRVGTEYNPDWLRARQ